MIQPILGIILVIITFLLFIVLPSLLVHKKREASITEVLLNSMTTSIFLILIISFFLLVFKIYNIYTFIGFYLLGIVLIGIKNGKNITNFRAFRKKDFITFFMLFVIIALSTFILCYDSFQFENARGGDSFENTYRARIMESNTLFQGYLAPGYFLFLAALHQFIGLFSNTGFEPYIIMRFIAPLLGVIAVLVLWLISYHITKNKYISFIPPLTLLLANSTYIPYLSQFTKIFHFTLEQFTVSLEQNLAMLFFFLVIYYSIKIFENKEKYYLQLFMALTIVFMTHLLLLVVSLMFLVSIGLVYYIKRKASLKKLIKINLLIVLAFIPELIHLILIWTAGIWSTSVTRTLILLHNTPPSSLVRSYIHLFIILVALIITLVLTKNKETNNYSYTFIVFSILTAISVLFLAPYRMWPFLAIITVISFGLLLTTLFNTIKIKSLYKYSSLFVIVMVLLIIFPVHPIKRTDKITMPITVNDGFVKATLKVMDDYDTNKVTFYSTKHLYFEGVSITGLTNDWRELKDLKNTKFDRPTFVFIDKTLNPYLNQWLPVVAPESGDYQTNINNANKFVSKLDNKKVYYEDDAEIVYLIE
ncbi:MAG: hypothetical protein HYS32_02695 [Candidatus Woesearchaeota archaeon]|nr:MAG: hypothetical protein HYS32_02695 [Candidatus Woesearchaeota archaeon]